jgi:hypothetical protein
MIKKWCQRFAAASTVACVIIACNTSKPGDSDSETHFACSDDKDCAPHGRDLVCIDELCHAASLSGHDEAGARDAAEDQGEPGIASEACPPGYERIGAGSDCVPTDCSAPDLGRSPPYSVEFRITNHSGLPLRIHRSVGLSIATCASGYTDTLATYRLTHVSCAEYSFCDLPAAVVWDGDYFVFPVDDAGEDAGVAEVIGEPSLVHAEAGRYRLTLPVYWYPPESVGPALVLYVKTVDFVLPDRDGIVDVAIDDSPYIVPCAEGSSERCVKWVGLNAPEADCVPNVSGGGYCYLPEAQRMYVCSSPVPIDPACTSGAATGPELASPYMLRCCP